MFGRKSQITYFIILGIIIILAASFIFYISTISNSKTKNLIAKSSLNSPLAEIRNYIEACFADSIKDSAQLAALSGGYFSKPKAGINLLYYDIPFYSIEGVRDYPEKEKLNQEFSKYIETALPFCLNDLGIFKERGISINARNPKAKSFISDNYIAVEIDYPISVITPDGKTFDLSEFSHNYKTKFGLLYSSAVKIVDEQIKNTNNVCLNCLSKTAQSNNLTFEIYRTGDSLIYQLKDNLSAMEPLVFLFANKYSHFSCTELPLDNLEFVQRCADLAVESVNYTFSLKDIPNLTAEVGKPFHYVLEGSGYKVAYESFTDLFSINKTTGVIQFVPKSKNIGIHNIWIKAEDGLHNLFYKEFRLEIK